MKIMSKKISLLIATVGILFLTGNLSAEETSTQNSQVKKVVQTECPVMGGKINKNLYVDYQGKRIYVCCGMCIGKFEADPEKYIKELEAKGISLEVVVKDDKEKASGTEKEAGHAGHQH